MSFVNDTGYPILIKGINEPDEVTFQIYGVPDGRTVELPILSSRTQTRSRSTYVHRHAAGRARSPSSSPPTVSTSTVMRTVKDAAGNVIHQDTFMSHYKTINGLIVVGRYPGDPPAGTQVLEPSRRQPLAAGDRLARLSRATRGYFARILLFLASCVSSTRPSASISGGM